MSWETMIQRPDFMDITKKKHDAIRDLVVLAPSLRIPNVIFHCTIALRDFYTVSCAELGTHSIVWQDGAHTFLERMSFFEHRQGNVRRELRTLLP